MKAFIAAVFALAFVGCVSTNSLDWAGREDSWLIWKEGPADVDEMVGVITPGEPTSSPLFDAIQGVVPTYSGNVRHLQWKALASDYHAYLIHTNQRWIVVNAFRSTP